LSSQANNNNSESNSTKLLSNAFKKSMKPTNRNMPSTLNS